MTDKTSAPITAETTSAEISAHLAAREVAHLPSQQDRKLTIDTPNGSLCLYQHDSWEGDIADLWAWCLTEWNDGDQTSGGLDSLNELDQLLLGAGCELVM